MLATAKRKTSRRWRKRGGDREIKLGGRWYGRKLRFFRWGDEGIPNPWKKGTGKDRMCSAGREKGKEEGNVISWPRRRGDEAKTSSEKWKIF